MHGDPDNLVLSSLGAKTPQEGSSGVKEVKRNPPEGAESGFAGVTCTACPEHWSGCCCLQCPRSSAVGWTGNEMCVLLQPPGTLGKEGTPEDNWGGAQCDRLPA